MFHFGDFDDFAGHGAALNSFGVAFAGHGAAFNSFGVAQRPEGWAT